MPAELLRLVGEVEADRDELASIVDEAPALAPPGLALARPLATIDIESTGPRPESDRIIEIALVKLHPDGARTSRRWFVNPGCAIPPEATAVHGYDDRHVVDYPPFAELAQEIAAELAGSDLCGFNLRAFDIPILRAEFARSGVAWPCDDARVVDAFVIFKDRERRDLASAVRFYCGRPHEGAHTALHDAAATLDVFLGQLARYPDLPRDLSALDVASGGRQPDFVTEAGHFRRRSDGTVYCAFGRNNGIAVGALETSFFDWILRKDFPADVKAFANEVITKRYRRERWRDDDGDDEQELDDGHEEPGPDPIEQPAQEGASDDDNIPF